MSKVIIALLILLFPIIALLLFYIIFFTPLEGPAACSGNEDKILFGANTGFKAPCEPSRWKVEGLLTGFTIALLIFSRREKKGREFSLRAG